MENLVDEIMEPGISEETQYSVLPGNLSSCGCHKYPKEQEGSSHQSDSILEELLYGDFEEEELDWDEETSKRRRRRRGKKGSLLSKVNNTDRVKANVIATIYAEMTRDIPEQHDSIFQSMKKRVLEPTHPPNLLRHRGKKGVISRGTYHAFKKSRSFFWARKYLLKFFKTGIKPRTIKNRYLNSDIVDKIKKMVERKWNNTLPGDAGRHYFHWRPTTAALNRCWRSESVPALKSLKKIFKPHIDEGHIGDITDLFIRQVEICGKKRYNQLVRRRKWSKGLKLKKVILAKNPNLRTFQTPLNTMFVFDKP